MPATTQTRAAPHPIRHAPVIAEKQQNRITVQDKVHAAYWASADSATFIELLAKDDLSLAKLMHRPSRQRPDVKTFEVVAVSRHGGMYRLNPRKIDIAAVEHRAAAGRPLRTIFETRFEKRERIQQQQATYDARAKRAVPPVVIPFRPQPASRLAAGADRPRCPRA